VAELRERSLLDSAIHLPAAPRPVAELQKRSLLDSAIHLPAGSTVRGRAPQRSLRRLCYSSAGWLDGPWPSSASGVSSTLLFICRLARRPVAELQKRSLLDSAIHLPAGSTVRGRAPQRSLRRLCYSSAGWLDGPWPSSANGVSSTLLFICRLARRSVAALRNGVFVDSAIQSRLPV